MENEKLDSLEEVETEEENLENNDNKIEYDATSTDSTESIETEVVEGESIDGNANLEVSENEETSEDAYEVDESKLSRKEKRKIKKEKKYAKIRGKILGPDINWYAPLSYRHLRLIGWISIAIAQLLVLNSISSKLAPDNPLLSSGWEYFVEIVADLSIPLFMIAVFATILNKNKTYKSVILFYLALWLTLGSGIAFAYARYAKGLINYAGEISENIPAVVNSILGKRAEVNVFGDLLALSLFNFFITYNPKKYFKGKKIKIFRAMCVLPLIVALISYIIKVRATLGIIDIPFELYPFLTTKPPFIYILFIGLSSWIKRRENKFKKYGFTKSQYNDFLKTKRNSFSFSLHVSIYFLVISILDLIVTFGITLVMAALFTDGVEITIEEGVLVGLEFALSLEFGQCVGLFFAIPFIMLFSYTKKFKDNTWDIIIPLVGAALIAFVYLEGGYQVVLKLVTGA